MHALTHHLPGLAVVAILASTVLVWLGVLIYREARLSKPSTTDCRQCQREPSHDRCGRCRA